MKIRRSLLSFLSVIACFLYAFSSFGSGTQPDNPYASEYILVTDTLSTDTIPLKDRKDNWIYNQNNNPFDLKDPSAIEKEVEYDPSTGGYIISEKVGEDYYRAPTYMSFEEYMEHQSKEQEKSYFKSLSGVSTGGGGGGRVDPVDKIDIKKSLADRLFGGSKVDIRPQGNIDLTFGADFQKVQNPILTVRQQRQGGFDFDMNIQMNVTGSIGEKLKLNTSYNTQATFDFENQMKLEYDSDAFSEDDIIKDIEAGNVSFPLRSNLIQGSQNLFGFKIDTQWGKLKLSMVASQQRSRQQQLRLEGGSQLQEFEVRADQYDENRHFFLSYYNRESFSAGLENLPQIKSLFKINPGDIEVWVTNDRNDYTGNGVQDIVAIADLGEPTRLTNENPNFQAPAMPRFRDAFTGEGLPDNRANDIYEALLADPTLRSIDKAVASLTGPSFRFQQAKDFEKVSARLLSPSEYTFHPELGFISLNFNLRPDQVLGVSFRYDYNGKNYKVGELTKGDVPADTTQPPPVIFVKMLKSTTTRVDLPYWDLMMKNVYSLGAFQISQEDFRLDIFYNDPQRSDIRFLPFTNLQGIPLLRVFNLDKLNVQGDPCPDGIFDFVPGLTIQPRNGRIMFPVLEPFGKDLVEGIDDVNLRDTFDFSVLYDSTITWAREFQDLNRFVIRGEYKSSGNSGGSGREISLGSFNLPQGSVRVTAGGQALVEGQDYEVDYNIGRVTILNDALLNSGVPVNVSFEDNTLFGFQTKSLLGVRADYEISEDFNVGATYLKLFERPFTQKVNVGDDPINNNMYGVDVNFTKDAPWLTRIVDGIPGIDTKEPSSLSFSAEAAFLQPGHSRAINQLTEDGEKDKRGVVYLDDFEGSTSSFDLRTPANKWVLASVPQGTPGSAQDLMFPEAKLIDSLAYGYNRAKLMWYRIDLSVGSDPRDDHYTVPIAQTEVFPNISLVPGFSNNIQTFDLTFRPSERGPYNFDLPLGQNDPAISAGITQQGRLAEPATRWGGIMRDLTVTDFEAANIEFIEFWMLNPFRNANGPDEGGDLYINLGNISEDILRDSRYFYENGIPTDGSGRTDDTNWSLIPRTQNVVNAFANNEADREIQDVGLDGQNDDGERVKFSEALDRYSGFLDPNVFSAIEADPANDNFVYFRDFPDGTSVLDRYSQFNNPQGNSQAPSANSRTVQSATNLPDSEDLNRDNTLNETEAYYQYRIPLRSVDDEDGTYTLNFNNPYVTDSIHGAQGRKWYRFKVPIDQPTSKIGGIQDFRAIRFIRMYLNNFEDDITLRFARLELARNQWRRYRRQLQVENGEIDQSGVELVTFDINDVNIEENSSRTPFGYIIPPGIQREQANNTAFANVLQNEQALAMEVCGLPRGTAKGIYKNINFDLRLYEELEMFVHAEAVQDPDLQNGDLALLLRLGSDFENNYYEYEVPLTISDTSNIPGYLEPEYKRRVWPVENDIVLPLKELTNLKLERNAASASLNNFFTKKDPRNDKNIMRIIGNPTLGPLKGMMIGVVNRDTMIANTHCAEIWVNELRVSGLDERGGMAAIGRLDLKLADFGDLTVAGELETIGFGGLEEKLQQRSRERKTQIDISTNLELGKFFGDKSGIKIPMYAQYSKTVFRPEFDPYDKDVKLDDKLKAASSTEERNRIKDQALDVTELKSINFTNVRKNRTEKQADKKPKPWNIENFSVSYSYTESDNRDPFIESDKVKEHNGSLNYSYSLGNGVSVQPFKKVSKSKWLKLLTDFNFNPVPNSFSFSTVMNREIQITKYRFTDLEDQFSTFYNKQFTWDRNYDLRWDLARSLKFNFSAVNSAVIDELKNFDPETNDFRPEAELNEEIWRNIRNFGRTKNYTHRFDIGYTAPTKQIPFLDWIQVKAQYNADYNWSAAALNVDSLGNVIQNSQRRQVTGDFNFENLYRKSKYLDRINRGSRGRRGRGNSSRTGRRSKNDRAGKAQSGLDDPSNEERSSLDKDGKAKKKRRKDRRRNRGGDEDGSGGGGKAADKKNTKNGGKNGDKKSKKDKNSRKKDREPSKVERMLIRPLMTLRKARLSYSENFGTVVPGFLPQTEMLGLSNGFDAPGWDFVGGLQPRIANNDLENDWLNQAAANGWITDNILQNQQVLQNYSQDIRARITLEPFKDFRIELEADRKFTRDKSVYFRDTTLLDVGSPVDEIVHSIPREIGSFSMSYFAMQTFFGNDIQDLFDRFDANRAIISQRLGDAGTSHPLDGGEYAEGYGQLQQNVLIPAFLAAYRDEDPNTVAVNRDYTKVLFRALPKINWQFTYNGLSKIPAFKEIFSNVSLSHGYRSVLTVNSFNTDTDFDETRPAQTEPTSLNFYSRFTIPDIVIDEQFAPLIGIKVDFQNDLGFRVDWKKSRNLRLNFNDDRLNETNTEEYVFGFDYKMQGVEFGFINGGKKSRSKKSKEEEEKSKKKSNNNRRRGIGRRGGAGNAGDLNFAFDFSYRSDITLFYDLKNRTTETVRGLKTIRISPSIDYDVNDQVNVRLFFERSQTIPATSASFPITNTQGGVTIRFSLN